jgi:hypothetical protein
MAINKSIFQLRFGANDDLYPTQEDLRVFLDSPKKEGGREPHRSDLTRYHELLDRVSAFERRQGYDPATTDARVKMFSIVLSHSQFFNPALELAVTQFKYHTHAFCTLDFKKPAAFIRSAEEELSGLNPKRKKDDAVKAARLQGMLNERKKTLEILRKRRTTLTAELRHIALYVRDNLTKIEKLCEASTAVLADPATRRDEEKRSIEDIKAHFNEQLKDVLHHGGAVSRQQIEAAQREVAVLSKELSDLLGKDLSALTRLYEAIQDHVKKYAHELDALLAELARMKNASFDEERDIFTRIERSLVSLISDSRFGMTSAAIAAEPAHEHILAEKRQDMLGRIFSLLQRERRARVDRRFREDRRKLNDPDYTGPEQRSGKERRSRRSRRT